MFSFYKHNTLITNAFCSELVIIYRSPVLLNKMQSKQDKNTIIIPDEISYWQEYLS